MIYTPFDLGITHFDLANNYGSPPGSAEENFGRILTRDLSAYRDELIVSTKAGYLIWPGPYGEWGSRKYLLASLDQSLKRMGLEYVDIFYSHRFDPHTPKENVAAPGNTAQNHGCAPSDSSARLLHAQPLDPNQHGQLTDHSGLNNCLSMLILTHYEKTCSTLG